MIIYFDGPEKQGRNYYLAHYSNSFINKSEDSCCLLALGDVS